MSEPSPDGPARPAGPTDPAVTPSPDVEHVSGPRAAPHVLLMYGDYECPYTRAAHLAVRALEAQLRRAAARAPDAGRRPEEAIVPFRYAYRHFPLRELHPHAQAAAEAAEAAHAQGRFWAMHDHLFAHQRALDDEALRAHAAALGLDVARFDREMTACLHAARVRRDVEHGRADGVHGTPTLFLDGAPYRGARTSAALALALGLPADLG